MPGGPGPPPTICYGLGPVPALRSAERLGIFGGRSRRDPRPHSDGGIFREIEKLNSKIPLAAYILAFAPEHFQANVRGSFVDPVRDKMELERAAAAV